MPAIPLLPHFKGFSTLFNFYSSLKTKIFLETLTCTTTEWPPPQTRAPVFACILATVRLCCSQPAPALRASSDGLGHGLCFASLGLQAATSTWSAQCRGAPAHMNVSNAVLHSGPSRWSESPAWWHVQRDEWQRQTSEEKYLSPLSFAKKEQYSCSKFWFSSFSPDGRTGWAKQKHSQFVIHCKFFYFSLQFMF